MIDRSPTLNANCVRHYSVKTDCKGCPITAVCWEGTPGILTHEKVDAHIVRMNAAVERASQGELFAEGA
jgi:hypothetical protein